MATAGEASNAKDCDCQNLFSKLRREPGAEPKKCCRHTKCTVAQLLELCKMDPDCIMNLFKVAKGDEKCLPQVEIDHSASKGNGEKDKYHFLMVDNYTQRNETSPNHADLSEVKNIIQNALNVPTATDTDRDRFNNILWPVSAHGTPVEGSIHQSDSKSTRPQSTTSIKKIPSKAGGTVQRHLEAMHIVVEDRQHNRNSPSISGERRGSFTREIYHRKTSPVNSETQQSLLKMEGDDDAQSKQFTRKKSMIKSRNSMVSEISRETGRSIIWRDDDVKRSLESQINPEIRSKRSSDDRTFSHLSLIVKQQKQFEKAGRAKKAEKAEETEEIEEENKKLDNNRKSSMKLRRGWWERFWICIRLKKGRETEEVHF